MPRPSEQTSEPHTLPPAELNPLINPLLAENMGRWAEVYFTSPPENREQAVLDLLRELEAEKSRRETTLASELAAVPPLVRCRNCGHDNPAVNKFCGMCGADTASEDSGTSGYSKTPILQDSRSISPPEPEPEPWSERSSSYNEPVASRHELSLFQAYRETESDDAEQDWNFEPVPSSSYRGYIGAVLAILILGLGYFAWRGMQNSQSSHDISAPPPPSASAPSSTTQPSAGNEAAAPPLKGDRPEPTASPEANPEAAAADTRNTAPSERAAKEPSAAKPEVPPTRPSVPRSSAGNESEVEPESTADKWGAEELSMAQRYLNGASGQRRDPAEAAKWLWRSIAKHNGQATLLLADMYLRGDGVPKNCDQARVLLDSAARKGVNGAGQRLRNLQAFGCQ